MLVLNLDFQILNEDFLLFVSGPDLRPVGLPKDLGINNMWLFCWVL